MVRDIIAPTRIVEYLRVENFRLSRALIAYQAREGKFLALREQTLAMLAEVNAKCVELQQQAAELLKQGKTMMACKDEELAFLQAMQAENEILKARIAELDSHA